MSDLLACLFRLLVKKMDWIGLLKGKKKRTTVQGMFVCVCVCVCARGLWVVTRGCLFENMWTLRSIYYSFARNGFIDE